MEIKTAPRLPGYIKFSLITISIALITFGVYLGQHIITPLIISLLFAILLIPVVSFLNKRWKIPNIIASLIAIISLFAFIGVIIFFIYWKVADISSEREHILTHLHQHLETLQNWIQDTFHLTSGTQENYLKQLINKSLNEGGGLSNALNSFTNALMNLILIPLYTFLILLYRRLFLSFLTKIVGIKNQTKLMVILLNIKEIIQSYIFGLFIELLIVAALTTGGLVVLGVQYAFLLGVLTALLNLIPYIGILCAAVLTIIAALINSTDPFIIIKIILMVWLIQLFDNNFLVPKIVGEKVKINALVSLVGVLIGGTLTGVAGMFLALPTIAIIKVIFDHIDSLKPYGYLMGDDLPKTVKWKNINLPDLNHGGHKPSK